MVMLNYRHFNNKGWKFLLGVADNRVGYGAVVTPKGLVTVTFNRQVTDGEFLFDDVLDVCGYRRWQEAFRVGYPQGQWDEDGLLWPRIRLVESFLGPGNAISVFLDGKLIAREPLRDAVGVFRLWDFLKSGTPLERRSVPLDSVQWDPVTLC